ncbi:hypothetical protein KOW79_014476 [Hemibagrus wyckioides]|uniref:Uncharacterized protein n=1 Tax=Hemibagrus wyckioides TaxID=337641 RepID=A0A9D3SJD7_9TELE|nr:hypothetical protein KOW79_014476 [Hemibagrus wyckioides]
MIKRPRRDCDKTLQDRVTDGSREPIAADEGVGTTCSVHPSPPPIPSPPLPPTNRSSDQPVSDSATAPAPAFTSKPESLKDGCADDDDNAVSTCSDNSRRLVEFRLIHVKENALMILRLRPPVFNLDGWMTDGASGGCDQTRVRGQDELKEDKEPWTGRLEENETAEGEGRTQQRRRRRRQQTGRRLLLDSFSDGGGNVYTLAYAYSRLPSSCSLRP